MVRLSAEVKFPTSHCSSLCSFFILLSEKKKNSPTCSLVVSEKLLNVTGLASEYFRRGFGFVSVARERVGEGRADDLLSLIKTVFGFY